MMCDFEFSYSSGKPDWYQLENGVFDFCYGKFLVICAPDPCWEAQKNTEVVNQNIG